jgi:hypothetical protein
MNSIHPILLLATIKPQNIISRAMMGMGPAWAATSVGAAKANRRKSVAAKISIRKMIVVK